MHHKFQLSPALLRTALLLVIESVLLFFFHQHFVAVTLVSLSALAGAVVSLYAATEAIEGVRSIRHMLIFLSVLVTLFVLFFAVQYGLLLTIEPGSFSALTTDPLTLILHSLMVLIFNPLYLPLTAAAKMLLIINTVAAVILIFFLLQNMWQFRNHPSGLGGK